MTEILRQLKMNAKVLRHQIGTGQCGQEQTQEYMESLILLIRNKKFGGRGEAAEQGRPPTPAGSYPFCRIITENGPHRSRFERDSDG